ncbi:MAG TPA: hypothetical protein VF384_20475 [Planctomycetota bacterium]
MMRTLVIVACAVFATARAQEKEFHGTVVGADGKPVANAPVDTYWAVVNGKLAPRAGTRTDAEGRFKIRVATIPRRPHPLMATDGTVTLGAATALDAEKSDVDVTLRLVPMVPVRGEITSKDLGAPIEGCFVSISHEKAIIGLVGVNCGGKFSLQLPPGNYRLAYHAADCIAQKGTTSVAADAKELDLGTIDLAPTVLSQLHGKAPPAWNVSDARGVDKSVQLADYKGKWVLLEFWGFW